MVSYSDEYQQKNQMAGKHSVTKSQQQQLSTQLVVMSAKYIEVAFAVMGADNMPSIKQMNEKSRRQQDNDNLMKKIEDEDVKAGRLA